MPGNYCLVLCTCPDAETARSLADALVGGHLAACVNIVPGLTSVYGWEGTIESATEHLLIIKTESAAFEAVEALLKKLHPYDLPEIIAIPLQQGSSAYLAWISAWLHSGVPHKS